MQQTGMTRGDRIIVSAQPGIELVVAHVAALRAGLVVVPVNPAYTPAELAPIVTDASPGAAVIDDSDRAEWISAHHPTIEVIDPFAQLNQNYRTPSGSGGDAGPLDPESMAMLCYTSGTTGRPKGAQLSHANILAGAQSLVEAWRWTGEDRLVLALPLFHIHGLGIGLHGTLLAGASAVLLPRFDPETVNDAIGAHRASLFFGVPTMYSRIAASSSCEGLSSLRLCVSGSAPLSADLHEAVRRRSGQIILERYGLTETMINTSNPYEGERRPSTVGFPLPGVDLRLDPEQGEILVRGPNVSSGYWKRPQASDEAFDPDGYFRTGDIGEFDEDGYLRIVGRIKELIITGGYNVYPREIEDVLRSHPDVIDVAVIGTPSRRWGEVVTAVVIPAGSGDAAALVDYAADRLAPYKRPRLVRFVDELPVNAMGKVVRAQLATELAADLSGDVGGDLGGNVGGDVGGDVGG